MFKVVRSSLAAFLAVFICTTSLIANGEGLAESYDPITEGTQVKDPAPAAPVTPTVVVEPKSEKDRLLEELAKIKEEIEKKKKEIEEKEKEIEAKNEQLRFVQKINEHTTGLGGSIGHGTKSALIKKLTQEGKELNEELKKLKKELKDLNTQKNIIERKLKKLES